MSPLRYRLTVAVVVTALVLAAVVPTAVADGPTLDVSVDDPDDGPIAVTVTDNGSAVENATVTVEALNATYEGEGNYTTDENGTVVLTAPDENVTVEITVVSDDETISETVELLADVSEETDEDGAGDGSFGARVSSFVHSLLGDRGDGDGGGGGIGHAVATWVLDNNPGNAPDHAGPPADEHGNSAHANDAGNENDSSTGTQSQQPDADRGPDHGQSGDGEKHGGADRGPPDHAGPDRNDGDPNARGR